MKKLMIGVAAIALLSTTVACADKNDATKAPETKPAANKVEPASSKQTSTVKLYAAPETSAKVITAVNVSQRLVPFYHQQGWIKVGDPADGKVGWINRDQFQSAMNDAIQQRVQTIYIQQTNNNGSKPEITVYQNGKKLTGEQAQAIYEKVQKQRASMQKHMQRFQERMNQWMNQEMQMMSGPWMTIPTMPVMQPVIIVENQPGKPAKLAPPAAPKPQTQAQPATPVQ